MAGNNQYYVGGKRVPGVTTGITGQLAWSKENLIRWAWGVGASGKSLDEARQGAMDAGKIAHAMIEADIQGQEVCLDAVEPDMRASVEAIVDRWRKWRAAHVAEALLSEQEFTSASMLYGGRLDLLYRSQTGRVVLCDVKTGGLYAEALVQTAAYAMLVEENTEYRVDDLAILRIPRNSTSITTLELPYDREGIAVETVRICRRLYAIQRTLESEV